MKYELSLLLINYSETLRYTRAELSKELSSKICVIKLNYKPITEAHSLKLKKIETVKIFNLKHSNDPKCFKMSKFFLDVPCVALCGPGTDQLHLKKNI